MSAASTAVAWSTLSSSVTSISSGGEHTCAIRSDGTVTCWGQNHDHQAEPPVGTFSAISAGASHTCGIRTDGTLACWGWNSDGQATPPTGTFLAVSAGYYYSCGIRHDATVVCWGRDQVGEATPPPGVFISIDAGIFHTCGLRSDGTVACWGDDALGQSSPPAGTFVDVSVGRHHTCGVRTDLTLACWGGDQESAVTPPPGRFLDVDAGWDQTCAVSESGTTTCLDSALGPAPAGTFAAVSTGALHACALGEGRLACWGSDEKHQVVPAPVVSVPPLPTWRFSRRISVSWSARAALTPVTTYDVRYARLAWNAKKVLVWRTWPAATSRTRAVLLGTPGATYEFKVRARDSGGGLSAWVYVGTTIPLDDRALSRSPGWQRIRGDAFYRSSAVRSARAGASLTLGRVDAFSISLVVTTCPTCGRVKVRLGSRLLAKVSLHSAGRADRGVIPVARWAKSHKGVLRIVVISRGAKVIVDGVAVR